MMPRWGVGLVCTALRHQHVHGWQTRPGTPGLIFGVSKPLLLQGHEPRSGFSTTYLFLFVAPRRSLSVWAYLRSGLRNIIPCLCIVAPGRVISCMVCHSPGLHGHLKLASCLSHGANLVVTLGSLVWPTLIAPLEGLLRQEHSLLGLLAVLGGILLMSGLLPILGACLYLPCAWLVIISG